MVAMVNRTFSDENRWENRILLRKYYKTFPPTPQRTVWFYKRWSHWYDTTKALSGNYTGDTIRPGEKHIHSLIQDEEYHCP